MIDFFRRLVPLLDRATRRRVLVAVLALLGLAVLEALALAALVPLMQILTAPELHADSSIVSTLTRVLGDPSPTQLALYLGLFTFTTYVVKGIAGIFVLRWTTSFALVEEAVMTHRLMGVYLRAEYPVHLERNSSEFFRTLAVSLQQIFRNAFVQGLSAVGDLFSVVFVGVVLAVSDPVLALVSALYFLVVAGVYQRVSHHVIGRAARQIHEDQVAEFRTINQSLSAVKEVKVRGAEQHFADEVHDIRRRLVPAYRTMALVSVMPRYVLELAMVGAAGLISLVAFSTQSVTSATATIGVFIAGGFRMLAPLNKVIFGISQARAALPAIEQVRQDIDELESDKPAVDATTTMRWYDLRPNIQVDDVTFSYVPGVPVLERVSLAIDPGEAIGLVGSSGAGKSTLVDLLLGLLEPDTGEILIDGWPIQTVLQHWQRMIGYVPQSIALFDDTVRANVALGVRREDVDDDQLWNALDLAQLADVVASLGNGLDHVVGEAGVQLSGGQRQRLGVARALYHDPQVLMFDEATSALDNETEFKLTEVFESLRGRVTTITIAHRLSTIRRCDRLLYLEHGHVVAEGSFAQLSASIPGFARMVELAAVDAH